jgi:hypothetical protein
MENLEKLEKAAEQFEAKAAKIENIESEVKSAKQTAENTAKEVSEVKKSVETIDAGVKNLAQWQVKKDEADKANQAALDQLIADAKNNKNGKPETKTFTQNFAEAVEANWSEIKDVSKGRKAVIELKSAGDMSISANLTGDGTPTYGASPIILPSQTINFRDLMPTTSSPNRTYIQHREKTTGEGAPAAQTEASAKAQVDVDFEEVKTVNEYVAGFTRFTKQFARELSFFTQTLPRVLIRKFYEAENSKFWTDVTGTSGISTSTGSETDDVKRLIDAIAYQLNSNYVPSYVLVNPLQLARLNKALYDSQNYAAAAGVVSTANGMLSIAGVPVIDASWVTDDKGLIIDRTYLERVEVEGLKVEFFEQDSDNVQKNMITARIECFEKVNLMLPASARYWDFGNES